MRPRAPHGERALHAGLPSPDAFAMILLRLAYMVEVMVVPTSMPGIGPASTAFGRAGAAATSARFTRGADHQRGPAPRSVREALTQGKRCSPATSSSVTFSRLTSSSSIVRRLMLARPIASRPIATAPTASAPIATGAIAVGPRSPGPRASTAVSRIGRRSTIVCCRRFATSGASQNPGPTRKGQSPPDTTAINAGAPRRTSLISLLEP